MQELPLLVSLGGLRLVERFGDWSGRPFAVDGVETGTQEQPLAVRMILREVCDVRLRRVIAPSWWFLGRG